MIFKRSFLDGYNTCSVATLKVREKMSQIFSAYFNKTFIYVVDRKEPILEILCRKNLQALKHSPGVKTQTQLKAEEDTQGTGPSRMAMMSHDGEEESRTK